MKNGSHWISLSDMMTGLMLIFMLIAILSISQKNAIVEGYFEKRQEIYKELKDTFKDKEESREITISEDLTIKFNNPDVLFDFNSPRINDSFNKILDDFIPDYLKIVNDSKYTNYIKEVRIEGHAQLHCTNNQSSRDLRIDYISCIDLSTNRAKEVLRKILDSPDFKDLSEDDKKKMLSWFMSIGISTGRPLYSSGSTDTVTKESRRVEFRIVTSSEELIEEIKGF